MKEGGRGAATGNGEPTKRKATTEAPRGTPKSHVKRGRNCEQANGGGAAGYLRRTRASSPANPEIRKFKVAHDENSQRRGSMSAIAAGVRRAACRHHVERGEHSLAEGCYRKLILLLDGAGRGWYDGDSCLK